MGDAVEGIENVGYLKGLVDNTITSFSMPSGVTSIAPYKFYNCGSLTSLDLTGCTSIGDYGMYGCANVGNNNFTIPSTVTYIGNSAFYQLGTNKANFTFKFLNANNCTLMQGCFYYASIKEVSGKFVDIPSTAFKDCNFLTDIDIESNGSLGTEAFRNSGSSYSKVHLKINNGGIGDRAFSGSKVSDFYFDPSSNVTSLGDSSFYYFGGARSNPSSNVLTFDFRNSTFTSIAGYCFSGNSNTTKIKYMNYYFPATLKNIYNYAFRYSDYINCYFTSEEPPTLSASGVWQNSTNYNIFVPYNSVNAYRTMTNWTSVASYIKGWAAGNTFTQGQILPVYNNEGYGLTWYSDKECTTQVTTVSDPTQILYCVVGNTIVAYRIDKVAEFDCTIQITDGVNTFSEGDMVVLGTVLTITGTPTTTGWIPYIFTVNGNNFTSGDTYTMNANLSVLAIYWDGVNPSYDPVFDNNSWNLIKKAFRENKAKYLWNVGDTKTLTTTDGNTYTLRISDMQEGRYDIANSNEKTNGVIEFVGCIKINDNTTFVVDISTGTNGWGQTNLNTVTLNTDFWTLLPSDLQNAISEISLTEFANTSPSPRTFTDKLFLPAETELFSTANSSAEGIREGCVKYDRWDYYISHSSSSDKLKYLYGGSSASSWWTRSAYAYGGSTWTCINSDGTISTYSTGASRGVSPCFAI